MWLFQLRPRVILTETQLQGLNLPLYSPRGDPSEALLPENGQGLGKSQIINHPPLPTPESSSWGERSETSFVPVPETCIGISGCPSWCQAGNLTTGLPLGLTTQDRTGKHWVGQVRHTYRQWKGLHPSEAFGEGAKELVNSTRRNRGRESPVEGTGQAKV